MQSIYPGSELPERQYSQPVNGNEQPTQTSQPQGAPQTTAVVSAPAGTTLLRVEQVVKEYHVGGGSVVTALRGVNLRAHDGEFIAIRGRSGAGKTTLLNIIAGLDNPTHGRVILFGRDLAKLNDAQRTALRRTELGFMFQAAHLLPTLTASENVGLLMRMANADPAERERRTQEALALVGLAERAHHRAPELSGGEQQRVAIARALVHAPRLVLADEPTGNLDSHTGLNILELMRTIAHRAGIGFIVTSHDPQTAQVADSLYDINDGVLTPAQA